MEKIGILAFGSLIDHPGKEIEAMEIRSERRQEVETPFAVEFARSSRGRAGAPTLVPHSQGSKVKANVIVIHSSTLEYAKDCLWRRELNNVGQGGHYTAHRNPGVNTLVIEQCSLPGLPTVLAARFPPNIEPLTAEHLAELAIASAKELADGRDGITYLIEAKCNGVRTPLSPSYEQEILRQTGTTTLKDAYKRVRR
jgi:hypothetical protein